MNCLYCHNKLNASYEDTSYGFYTCDNCPIHVKFYYFDEWDRPSYIHMAPNDYLIELCVKDKACQLWYRGDDSPDIKVTSDPVLYINYLPDVTPDNAEQWINRLLDMMVFS